MKGTPGEPDRRRAQRFQVALPVELEGGTGVTRDVSVYGVFFETDRAFVPGEPIQLTLVLEHVAPGQFLRLRCQGTVVRVEQGDGVVGIAVAITAYWLNVEDAAAGPGLNEG